VARLCIVGTGHVGLVYGVAFALAGHDIRCTDVDSRVVENLNRGQPTFFEPGLEDALLKAQRSGQIAFSTDTTDSVRDSDVVFLCVPTPSLPNGSIDLSYVAEAAESVGKGMRSAGGYRVVAVKSTVLPGTTEGVVRPALEKASEKKAGRDFGLSMNPEFLREGSAVEDAMVPDRIVIGALDEKSADIMKRVYEFATCPVMETDLRTAEMIKYATNAFLATKVSFANELANLCDAFGGIDVDHVVEALGLDPRINPKFLKAGLGFGGSCFPKDVRALMAAGKARGYSPRLLQATLDVNEDQPLRAIELAEKAVGSLKGKRVAILGLSFKGGSDDVRESRAVPLAKALLERGATVVGYDPAANDSFKRVMPRVVVVGNVSSALADADVCIVHNDWPQWRDLKAADFSGMKRKVVIDGRRILNRNAMKDVTLSVLGG